MRINYNAPAMRAHNALNIADNRVAASLQKLSSGYKVNSAKWTGVDISENQIAQAKILSEGMDIDYFAIPTEELDFPKNSFDVITACQCFVYFKHEQVIPKFVHMLKKDGRILVMYMAWQPSEDMIAGESEKLVLKYNPAWSGAGEKMHPVWIPDCYNEQFDIVYREEYPLEVPFTLESWNGRMKACRGIGASLTGEEVAAWEKEHKRMLAEMAPERFTVLHYGAVAELKLKG